MLGNKSINRYIILRSINGLIKIWIVDVSIFMITDDKAIDIAALKSKFRK